MRYVAFILITAAPAWPVVWGLGVAGGLGVPVGDFADIAEPSAVADGRAIFCLTPNTSLTAGVAYRFNHKPKDFARSEEASYDVTPVLVGANYRFDYLPCMPYAGGGVAAAVSRATVPTAAGLEEKKSVRLGAFAEGGMEYYLGVNFGLDVRGRFISTFGGDKTTNDGDLVDAGNYLAFDAVLGFFFYP
jgi:hypothetical protein